MIGFISGIIKDVEAENITILTASGIGHIVYTVEPYEDKDINQNIELYIYTIQKEQSTDLYGFKLKEDQKFFELLLQGKGVGPKMTRSLMAQLGTLTIKQAIIQNDIKTLTSVTGVGKKLSQQLILDLKDKIENICVEKSQSHSLLNNEIIDGLECLGLSKNQIQEKFKRLQERMDISQINSSDLMKHLLRI